MQNIKKTNEPKLSNIQKKLILSNFLEQKCIFTHTVMTKMYTETHMLCTLHVVSFHTLRAPFGTFWYNIHMDVTFLKMPRDKLGGKRNMLLCRHF